MNYLEEVKKFMLVGNQPVLKKPILIKEERANFRVNLIKEETQELEDAIAEGDLVGIMDAFVDLQYVLSGAVHEFGMGNLFNELFAEVQRSNMTKFCNTIEEARMSVEAYKTKGVDTYFGLAENRFDGKDRFVIYRQGDDKVLKGVHYEEPNIKGIYDKYLSEYGKTEYISEPSKPL